MERMRLTLLGNPEMMAELRRASRTRCFSHQRHGLNSCTCARQVNPGMAQAVTSSPEQFARAMQQGMGGRSEAEMEKQRQIQVRPGRRRSAGRLLTSIPT
jgi:hypothetical protein